MDLQALFHITTSLDSARYRSLGAGLLLSWDDGTLWSEQIVDFRMVGRL